MAFETFKRRTMRPTSDPYLTIQRKGIFSINRPAFEALGEPQAVELLYDSAQRLIGLRKVPTHAPHGYNVRGMGKNVGTWLISGIAFTSYYGIDTSKPVRRIGRMDGDMLVIDLKEEGVHVPATRDRNRSEDRTEPERSLFNG